MGGSISSLFSGSPSTPNLQTYQPQYTSQADTNSFNAINSIYNNNPYLQNQGTYQSIMQQGLNNPYAAGAQTAANTAGQQYGQLGQQGMASSIALNQGAMNLLPYVSQVENTAMDPQSALYNRTLQQVSDQANVSNAQNGLTGSPYGAGTANAAKSNFNIDWQNNQLARQTQGIGAAATGLGAAGSAMNNASNLGQTAAGSTVASGQVPNEAYLGNLGALMTVLNNYGASQSNANAQTQTAQQEFNQYLSGGEAQANQQAGLDQINYTNQLAAQAAQNQAWGGLTNALGGFLNYNPSSSTGGSSTVGISGTGSANNASGASSPANTSLAAQLSQFVSSWFA